MIMGCYIQLSEHVQYLTQEVDLYNNYYGTISYYNHKCVYIHLCTDPPPPPKDVHFSDVNRNRLDFTWDPVQTTCPVVEYKVNAVNCGVCPTATHNTSITCVVDGGSDMLTCKC